MRSSIRRTTVACGTRPPRTSTPPTCMWTGPCSAWIAERSAGERESGLSARRCGSLLGAPAARSRAEDVVPPRGADAEPAAVVLEVVAHVELAQALARARPRLVVMKVVVRHVVQQVAAEEAGAERERVGAAEREVE